MTYIEKHCEGCKHYKAERVKHSIGLFYFNTLKNLLMNFELENLPDEELLACTYLADNFKSDCIQFIQARTGQMKKLVLEEAQREKK